MGLEEAGGTVAERRRRAYKMHLRGIDHGAIAEQLGTPGGPAGVAEDVRQALRHAIGESYADVEARRQTQLALLDVMRIRALDIMEAAHPVLYEGVIVEGVENSAPRLAAIQTVLKLMEREAKLLGSDSAAKVDVSGIVRYELAGVDIAQLT